MPQLTQPNPTHYTITSHSQSQTLSAKLLLSSVHSASIHGGPATPFTAQLQQPRHRQRFSLLISKTSWIQSPGFSMLQGNALNAVASRNFKVMVVGNPCNTNALICLKNAPNVPAKNFHALTRLDESRAKFQQRGGVLIQKWGRSSAASTAVSIVDAMKSLVTPTPEGNWFSSRSKVLGISRRKAIALILSSSVFAEVGRRDIALALPSVAFREYIDTFDGYSFNYPQNWIQVRGAGADIFFRDPFVLDENISVEMSSPSSSRYKSVEELGPPQEAGKKVLKQYLTEFMSTRLGVRRESNVLSTSSRVADDGKLYYQVEVNIKSYANTNELAVMPQDRPARLEWNRRYLSVLGVENNRLYELRLQTPENVFLEEENDLRQVMDSFRVNKVAA